MCVASFGALRAHKAISVSVVGGLGMLCVCVYVCVFTFWTNPRYRCKLQNKANINLIYKFFE